MKHLLNSILPYFKLLDNFSSLELISRLTVIFLLIHFGVGQIYDDYVVLGSAITILGALSLFIPKIIHNKFYWASFAFLYFVFLFYSWTYSDNHLYLWGYFIFALSLIKFAPKASQQDLLFISAKWLIGLCMLFAVIQKLISPTFLNGDFFLWTFLTDTRFQFLGYVLDIDLMAISNQNDDLIDTMKMNARPIPLVYDNLPKLMLLSKVMTWYVMIIESVMAILFLLPHKWGHYGWRHASLIFFGLGVYPLVPVRGFAAILIILGLSLTKPNQRLLRFIYLALLIYIYLFASFVKGSLLFGT